MWIAGARLIDPPSDAPPRAGAVRIEEGRIVELAARAPRGAFDASGLFLVPAAIDAHVHLAFAGPLQEVARAELAAGVAAVLDLGMPEKLLGTDLSPLRIARSGPLLTAPGGYPTRSWGKDGYGAEVATEEEARAAVRRFHAAGARFAKLSFDERYPMLSPEVAHAAVLEARRLGMRAAAHALSAPAVRAALAAGCDVLAHTPLEPVEVPPGITIISTLRAFQARPRPHARIVYGTDLGNEGTAPGIDGKELELLASVMSPRAVLRAATSDAADLLGMSDLGRLTVGARASLLALAGDPLRDPSALARPAAVWIEGDRLRPAAGGSA